MYEKIDAAIHIGTNILIVAYNKSHKWQFKVINKEGKIVQETCDFATAEEAKKIGSDWINHNLTIEKITNTDN